MADRQNREAWEAAGAPDGRERVRRLAKRILETHRPVAIDPAVDGEIRKRFTILMDRFSYSPGSMPMNDTS